MIIHTDSLWIHFEENSVDIYLSRMDNCTMAFALQEFSLSIAVIFKVVFRVRQSPALTHICAWKVSY